MELQLPAYTITTRDPSLSLIYDLHHSSWQHRILNPLSEARGRTCILMDSSQVCNLLSHDRNSQVGGFDNQKGYACVGQENIRSVGNFHSILL